jgi:hypothetical protein
MEKTVGELPSKETFDERVITLFDGYLNTRLSSFEEQLNKLVTIEE